MITELAAAPLMSLDQALDIASLHVTVPTEKGENSSAYVTGELPKVMNAAGKHSGGKAQREDGYQLDCRNHAKVNSPKPTAPTGKKYRRGQLNGRALQRAGI